MTNPFQTNSLLPNWTSASEILKGDVPGHPFHGNQYANPGFDDPMNRRMGAGWNALMISAHARDLVQNGRSGEVVAQAHDGAAREHRIAAEIIRKSGAPNAEIAAQAHEDAARMHEFAAQSQRSDAPEDIKRDNTMLARGSSGTAFRIASSLGMHDMENRSSPDSGVEFRTQR
jgi:hypothetical protein